MAKEEELALKLATHGEQQSDLVKETEKSVSALKVGSSSKFSRELVEATF